MSATRPPAFEERYAPAVEASRRGAHRARPNAVVAVLPVLAGLAVITMVAAGSWLLLGKNGTGGSGPVAAAPTLSTHAPAASTTSAAEPAASATAGTSATGQASASGSASSTTAAGAVDRTLKLKLLNSVTVKGLAKKVAARLEADGWTVGTTGNSLQRNLAVTKVYYATADQEATAQQLVTDLGYGKVSRSAALAGAGLTVVLGQDAAS